MKSPKRLLLTALVFGLFACALLSEVPPATNGVPTDTLELQTPTSPPVDIPTPTEIEVLPSPTGVSPLPTEALPPPTDTLPPELSVEEAILILEPGPGSRVLSPVRIAGIADPTFEQHLLVRIVLDDGAELAVAPTIIQADAGNRGPFEVEVSFTVEGGRQAFIEVSTSSPRDGGVTHLASVIVTLADSGSPAIVPVTPHPERIVILQPALGATIAGGVAHVSGFALASFEQTLVVDVIDEQGQVVGSQPLIVDSPELGQPGPFSVDVPYTLPAAGAGRIVVHDPSVAFAGDVHLASVEVQLAP